MNRFVRSALPVLLALLAAPAFGAPVVLNPNFLTTDVAANTTYNQGTFFIENWIPVGYASNSVSDPGQYDNGYAGGRTVVGFLSGPGSSLTQTVTEFTPGTAYQIIVGAIGRRGSVIDPFFQVFADNLLVFGPQNLDQVDPLKTSFITPFTEIVTLPFTAQTSSVTIKFENAQSSALTASTLLTGVEVGVFGQPRPTNATVPEPISLAIPGCRARRARAGSTPPHLTATPETDGAGPPGRPPSPHRGPGTRARSAPSRARPECPAHRSATPAR